MLTIPEQPHQMLTTGDAAAHAIVIRLLAEASAQFPELWSAGHVKPGGTMERDREIFVRGAAYGLAWAVRHLDFQEGS